MKPENPFHNERPIRRRRPAPRVISQSILDRKFLWTGLCLCFCLLQGAMPAQTVRFNQAQTVNGTLALSWEGSAAAYEVQGATSLAPPTWQFILATTNTSAIVPLAGSAAYFRILPAGDPAAATISDQRRLEILNSIAAWIATLVETDASAPSQELAAFLSAVPELRGVGITEDTSVYARFIDGRPLFIVNNRLPATDEELAEIFESDPQTPPESVSSTPPRRSVSTMSVSSQPRLHSLIEFVLSPGLPASSNALLFKASLYGLEAPMLDHLAPALEARGYNVSAKEASLWNLMDLKNSVSDVGVFYLDTHGMEVVGLLPYALLTSTRVTRADDEALRERFARGEIAYGLEGPALFRGVTVVPRGLTSVYAILPPFVANNWKFGKNSLVYMDVCDSQSAQAFWFRELSFLVGAAAYAGWTKNVADVWAAYATTLVFDTLLGAGQIYKKLSPKHRPFDLSAVRSYIRGNADTDPRSGAQLIFTPSGPANGVFALLTPSIQNMAVDETTGELRITGLFDPAVPAKVRIQGDGSKEIEVMPEDWRTLVAPLPANESPFGGYVTVFQREHPSNTVPLTEWRLQSQLTRTFTSVDQQPSATFELDFRLRADVHSHRLRPYESPVFRGSGADTAQGSTARMVSASGVYHYPNDRGTLEWSLDGPIELPLVPFGMIGTGFRGVVLFRSDGSATVQSFVSVEGAMTETVTLDGEQQSYPRNLGTGNFPPGETTWDRNTYTIHGGEGPAVGDAGTYKWQDATATFPPDPNLPGYAE